MKKHITITLWIIALTVIWFISALMLFYLILPPFFSTEELIFICLACILFASTIVYIIVRWKRKLTPENKKTNIRKMLLAVFFVILLICFVYIPLILHLPTNCRCEQPVFRWKYAIYYGECFQGEGGNGNNFQKIEGTGWREYFGLRDFECPCDKYKFKTNSF